MVLPVQKLNWTKSLLFFVFHHKCTLAALSLSVDRYPVKMAPLMTSHSQWPAQAVYYFSGRHVSILASPASPSAAAVFCFTVSRSLLLSSPLFSAATLLLFHPTQRLPLQLQRHRAFIRTESAFSVSSQHRILFI